MALMSSLGAAIGLGASLAPLLGPGLPTAPAGAGGGGAPVCDAGPNIFLECSGPLAMAQLDGTNSFDPGGLPLTYSWTANNCPGFMFDDPTSPTPIITFPVGNPCITECGAIRLTVSNGSQSSECGVAVFVEDTTPPTITCPSDVVLGPGDPTDPANTGMPTVSDPCDANPTVTSMDTTKTNGTTTTITRVWTVTDLCGNSASCTQTITIEEPPAEGEASLDIKPGSCPNPLNTKSGGVLPAGLLGSDGFDVTQVDTSSLFLMRADGVGGSVAPVRIKLSDVGTPFDGELCDCHTLTGDGTLDLSLKFDKADVISVLQLGSITPFTDLELKLVGNLLDGTSFEASDCIRVQ